MKTGTNVSIETDKVTVLPSTLHNTANPQRNEKGEGQGKHQSGGQGGSAASGEEVSDVNR